MPKIKKVLVANRGEIALRVIRSAKELGIKTVAVYSEVDRSSLHVRLADEAVLLGPAPSKESYLKEDKILAVCKELGVDAIHPGYGFLSENAGFAEKVEKEGIVFIGPSPASISTMGDKLAAKQAVSKFDVPLVPGTDKAIADVDEAIAIAEEIGYPVMIKASAGGGGKGMRIVENPGEIKEQMERAISEADSAFGDGSVFIEKYIASPKHIEFQILGDKHGNTVHLFERDCSVQRRHQKVIEEAPSAFLDEELRAKMGQAAIGVAKSCDYYGAGTVEFIMDEKKNFYFLEMNTRLQVEHPVTEQITGLDLVKEQIRIAEGEKLSFTQEDLSISGHSIEVRVYAEDPRNNFLPDIGTLHTYIRPQGIGVRVDDAFEQGMEIPIHYDPMIAKLVTFGADRDEARSRMVRAIGEYFVIGVKTTLDFSKEVMDHPSFVSGDFSTNFVAEHYDPEEPLGTDEKEIEIGAMVIRKLLEENGNSRPIPPTSKKEGNSNWRLRMRND